MISDVQTYCVADFACAEAKEPFYPPSNVTAPLEFDPPSWEPLSKDSLAYPLCAESCVPRKMSHDLSGTV